MLDRANSLKRIFFQLKEQILKAPVLLFAGTLILSSLCLSQPAYAQSRTQVIFTPSAITPDLSLNLNTSASENQSSLSDITNIFPLGNAQSFQPSFQVFDTSDTEILRSQIDSILGEEGAYSDNLIEGLISIGRLYREEGQILKSIESLEKAQQLTRIEFGLFSANQIPIMKELADSYKFNGEIIKSRAYYNRYYTMDTARHEGNIDKRIQSQINLGDDLLNLALFADNHNLSDISELILLHFDAFSSYQLATRNLFRARSFDQSIQVISQLQKASMVNAFYLATTPKAEIDNLSRQIRRSAPSGSTTDMPSTSVGRGDYTVNGSSSSSQGFSTLGNSRNISQAQGSTLSYEDPCFSSYENQQRCQRRSQYSLLTDYFENEGVRLLAFDIARSSQDGNENGISVTTALDLADWQEVVENRKEAREIYEQAYNAIKSSDAINKDALFAAHFSPNIPIQIPVYIEHEYSPDSFSSNELAASKVQGFIDVSIQLNRYGKADRAKVVFATSDIDEKFEDLLLEDITSNQYRPYFDNGTPVRKTFTVRYYVSTLN